jgi:hypothetical protein
MHIVATITGGKISWHGELRCLYYFFCWWRQYAEFGLLLGIMFTNYRFSFRLYTQFLESGRGIPFTSELRMALLYSCLTSSCDNKVYHIKVKLLSKHANPTLGKLYKMTNLCYLFQSETSVTTDYLLAPIFMMTMCARGFVLWIMNVGLMIYLGIAASKLNKKVPWNNCTDYFSGDIETTALSVMYSNLNQSASVRFCYQYRSLPLSA